MGPMTFSVVIRDFACRKENNRQTACSPESDCLERGIEISERRRKPLLGCCHRRKTLPSKLLDEIRQADARLSRHFVKRTVVNPALDRSLVSFQANTTEN